MISDVPSGKKGAQNKKFDKNFKKSLQINFFALPLHSQYSNGV